MSKAENGFKVIRENQIQELSKALQKSCEFIAEDCERCPLEGTPRCAEEALPPGFQKDDKEEMLSICADWLTLHFRGEAND